MDHVAPDQSRRVRNVRRIVESSPPTTDRASSPSLSEVVAQNVGPSSQGSHPLSQGPFSTNLQENPGVPIFDADLTSYEIPSEVLQREIEAAVSDQVTNHRPHKRYVTFFRRLWDDTNTDEIGHFCVRIYPHMVHKARTVSFDDSYKGTKLDAFAHAFMVYVWLFVCSRYFHGQSPTPGEYLHQRWASYFLSAFELSRLHGVFPTTYDVDEVRRPTTGHEERLDPSLRYFMFAIRYWEDRFFEMTKARSWASEPWLGEIDQLDYADLVWSRNDTATEYLNVIDEGGIPGLVRLLLNQEESMPQTPLKNWPEDEKKSPRLFQALVLILASIDEDLLEAIITGQVARLAQAPNSRLPSLLARMEKKREDQPPSIYINSICDEAGFSPTPFQWRSICDLMDLYVRGGSESDELAIVVDQLIHPADAWPVPVTSRHKRLRRYAEFEWLTQEERDLVCTPRRKTISDFVANMRTRLQEEYGAEYEHMPLMAPVVEVGFSDKVFERLRQHRRHQSSNYIMNLAEALFKYQYPGMFRLHQHIIYRCWREIQPWYAEILLSRLAQSYTYNAGGFNHYGAGSSNSSSFDTRSIKDWERFQAEICADDGFWRRLEKLEEENNAALAAAAEPPQVLEARKNQADYIKAFTRLVAVARKVFEAEAEVAAAEAEVAEAKAKGLEQEDRFR
ncbi:MAG: hypothetical protein LQ338_004318 [Usnochroma carphineum]|nr:MAG: hypothetical protein LQ338_004318 [Usnochroma carphineum]